MSRQATKGDLLAICRALGRTVYETQSSEVLATVAFEAALEAARETRTELLEKRTHLGNLLHKTDPENFPPYKEQNR